MIPKQKKESIPHLAAAFEPASLVAKHRHCSYVYSRDKGKGLLSRFFVGLPGSSGDLESTMVWSLYDPKEKTLIGKERKQDQVRVNEDIRSRQVRVIDEEGTQLGIMSPRDAIREAMNRGFDLVEVAPGAVPPVCRIMNYGKYRYEQRRRAREARKNQHTVSLKEMKYRPKIDKHDFDFKTNHVRSFLKEGNKVRITIMFRGREMAHQEFGRDIIQRVIEATEDLCIGDCSANLAKMEGRNMSIVLTPAK